MASTCRPLSTALSTAIPSCLHQSVRPAHALRNGSFSLHAKGTHRSISASASAMASKDWNATQYMKFETQRTRPARDLLAQVPLTSPKRIVDIGCGPGNSTEVLLQHFPQAHIAGIDSSPDMIEKAKKRLPELEFTIGDLESFEQEEPADLLYSNAVYQWVPYDKRMQIFTRLIKSQAPGGVFAFQVPDNFNEPSHEAMRAVADEGPWAEHLHRVTTFRKPFQSPQELYDNLKPLCSEINIWHTSYYHILEDHQAIVEWVKGTGLQPYLNPLSSSDRESFLKEYLKRVEKSYTPLVDGKVSLRYPRLFLVAVRA